jgi:hypothetical protein
MVVVSVVSRTRARRRPCDTHICRLSTWHIVAHVVLLSLGWKGRGGSPTLRTERWLW